MLELSFTVPVWFWLEETDTNDALSYELAWGLVYVVPELSKLLIEVVKELLLKKYWLSMCVLLSYNKYLVLCIYRITCSRGYFHVITRRLQWWGIMTMLPIVIVYPFIAAGSWIESVAVSVDSSLEQDEKDIARITKKSREREIFILFLFAIRWRSKTKQSKIQTIQSNCYKYKN